MPSPCLRALPLATLALCLGGVPRIAAQSTRPERTGGAETSSYADVTGFLDSLARQLRATPSELAGSDSLRLAP